MPDANTPFFARIRSRAGAHDNWSCAPLDHLAMTLPTPDPAFHWSAEAWGHALRCRPLAAIAQHAFTTRQLQLRSGGPRANPDRWTQAVATVGASLEQLIRVRQVHAAGVRVLKDGETGPAEAAAVPDGDAIVANATGYVLSVQVADCVPILMASAKDGVAAAVHAGWRGTCAGVARAAVESIRQAFDVRPSDLTVAIGPSIGVCCYEVGQSVADAFAAAGARDQQLARWFTAGGQGALRLDLWAANRDQLVAAGVREDRIHLSGLCTQTHSAVFESYRVDGQNAGRMLALVAVPG
jgi:YfiH family protein